MSSRWPSIRLEDACVRVTDGTHQSPRFEAHGIPFLVISDVVSGEIDWSGVSKWVNEETYEANTSRCRPERGDVLYTAVGSFGVAVPVETDQRFMFQRHIAHIKPDPRRVHTRFLAHILNSPMIRAIAERVAKGVAQRTVTLGDLKNFEIPLPPLAEQRSVADILDKADAIRRKRKEAIALTEELLRAAFLDMFGDPVTNPKGWETCSLEDLCSNVVDCPHTTPTYSGTPRVHPCVRTSDLQDGFLDWSTTKYVDPVEHAERIARLRPEPGDVLYSREGERFGIGALIPDGIEACLGQRMMLLRAKRTVASPAYVWGTLNSAAVYRQAMAEVGGSTSPHVNVKAIRRFRVCRPPLPMQARYSEVYARAVALRERHLRAAGEAQELFSSLVQRAFSGQRTNVKAIC